MTVETIPAVRARTHFGEIMKKSYSKGARFIVEKSGIPMVVILNAQEYSRMVEASEERFKILDRIKSKLPKISEDVISKDVSKAVSALESAMLKAVIDTNQFVSALISKQGLSSRLLDSWRRQNFILITSPEIIAEIKRVLEYPHIAKKYKLSKTDIQSLLVLIEHEAVVIPEPPIVHIVKDDPDDDRFLACAIAAKADYIVTGDQHLLSLGSYKSISIVTVKDFLSIN